MKKIIITSEEKYSTERHFLGPYIYFKPKEIVYGGKIYSSRQASPHEAMLALANEKSRSKDFLLRDGWEHFKRLETNEEIFIKTTERR